MPKYNHGPFRSKHPPGWWPENETWPPKRFGQHKSRGRFFRQFGCLFIFILIVFSLISILLIGKIAAQFGWISVLPEGDTLIRIGIVLAVFAFLVMIGTARRFLRTTFYINQVLKAADQIADGDYSARVYAPAPPELRSLGKAFNQMTSRLEESDQIRRNQLADVTHELRTPLTVIQGNLEAMMDGIYQPDQQRLASLYEETETMSHLLDDLRTLVLAESGALALQKEPTDLVILVNDLILSFKAQADERGINLDVAAPDEIPLISISSVRMREVFSNLITNAIRHTPQGGSVLVKITTLTDQEPHALRIEVCDSGEGIAPQDLELVFERFYKASDSGGMGLGLSIAKKLVEAHGGTLQAESEPDTGTTMIVTLPFELA